MPRFRPRPHVSGYFRIRNFFFPYTATVHTYPANSIAHPENYKFALQCGKNISVTNPITCGRVNPDIFLSDDEKACPVSHRTINQCGGTTWRANRANLPPLSRPTAHALKTFQCRGALGTRVNPDTIGYVWKGEFDLNPERKSCGFKNIRIRVDGALGWKVHDRAQSFVLRSYSMYELSNQHVSIGQILSTE